jgi:hypothetical protein
MGTAFGLALTGLVFSVSRGVAATSAAYGHAFSVATMFLAGVALAAGVLSWSVAPPPGST